MVARRPASGCAFPVSRGEARGGACGLGVYLRCTWRVPRMDLRPASRSASPLGTLQARGRGDGFGAPQAAASADHQPGPNRRPGHTKTPAPGRDPPRIRACRLTCTDEVFGKRSAGEHVRTPYKGRNKPASQKNANRAHARLRSPGGRANAQLKSWRILHKLRCSPWRADQMAKAIHVLQAREIR
jgi:hypothetical protein